MSTEKTLRHPITVTLPVDLVLKLRVQAKKENRKLSNMVATACMWYLSTAEESHETD